MEIGYKFSPKEIQRLSNFKNPSIVLRKENTVKNGKHKIHLTKNMFNKLLSENQLKCTFTDKRKQYCTSQIGNGLGEIFKSILPHAIKFGKKVFACFRCNWKTTTTSHLINKSLNKKKKKGGNIKINLSQSDVKKINNILGKLSNMKLTNYKSFSEQNGSGIFTSLLLPLIGSMIPSLLNKGSGVCCKKDNFFLKK